MSPVLDVLPHAVAWIVHPAAGIALASFASVVYSRQGRQFSHVLRASGIIVILAVLGATWVVHPAAGLLIGFLAQRAFHRWQQHLPALAAGLLAAGAFMALGAGWLVFPLMVMGLIWLFTAFTRGALQDRAGVLVGVDVPALPEQAGGVPILPATPPDTEMVMSAADVPPRRRPTAPAPPEDAFTALQLDARLPGDIRAQLALLDTRTAEALMHLRALGQESSEGGYVARAIREEYAPASVQAYLNLPRTRADVTPIEGTRTGHDLLREQLDLLLGAVQDILDSVVQAGGQNLLTHQRFLIEKFGKPKRELDV